MKRPYPLRIRSFIRNFKLFQNRGCACCFEVCNDFVSFFFSNVLFKNSALFNSRLSFDESKSGECAYNFDNVDFLSAAIFKYNVEFGLFFSRRCGSRACCGSRRYSYGSRCGNAEFLLECLYELVKL